MVPNPVSHPSDVEMRELRAISDEFVHEAAFTGHASSCFHGYRVMAVRMPCERDQRIDLFVEHEGSLLRVFEHTWGTVTAPSFVTMNPI